MSAKKILARLLRDTDGATAVEYGLIAGLIVIGMVSAMSTFANEVNAMWGIVDNSYEEASNSTPSAG